MQVREPAVSSEVCKIIQRRGGGEIRNIVVIYIGRRKRTKIRFATAFVKIFSRFFQKMYGSNKSPFEFAFSRTRNSRTAGRRGARRDVFTFRKFGKDGWPGQSVFARTAAPYYAAKSSGGVRDALDLRRLYTEYKTWSANRL